MKTKLILVANRFSVSYQLQLSNASNSFTINSVHTYIQILLIGMVFPAFVFVMVYANSTFRKIFSFSKIQDCMPLWFLYRIFFESNRIDATV